MFQEQIKMAFCHNLLISNVPDIIGLKAFSENEAIQKARNLELQSFGLFDAASPNFVTYYPEVKAEDLAPKESDFVYPVFRSLSEVIVHKNWNPIDFSMNGVLKKSMPLLKGQTVYPNHEALVGNEVGAILEVAWENSYTTSNGIVVPAGINSKLKIDGKSNPKIARGVMMDPPSIHSTSVTVNFLWDKSHDLSQDDFFRKLGTMEKGTLVRKIASKINKYQELSFVPHGADAFAQKIGKDGKIVNPIHANATYNLSETQLKEKKESRIFAFDFKVDLVENEDTILLSSNDNENSFQQNNENMNPQLMIFVASLAAAIGYDLKGTETDKLTDDQIKDFTTAFTAYKTTNEALSAENTRLKGIETKYTESQQALAEAVANKTKVDNITSELRAKVEAAYLKSCDNRPVESISNMIKTADYSALQALSLQYDGLNEEKYPLSCGECGSHKINRASSASNGDDGNGENKTAEQKMAEIIKGKQSTIELYSDKK